MSRSILLLFKTLGAIVGAATFGFLAILLVNALPGLRDVGPAIVVALIVIGLILGWLLIAPPLRSAHHALAAASAEQLAGIGIGLLIGALLAALLSVPLSLLPAPLRQLLPVLVGAAVLYLAVGVLRDRPHDLADYLQRLRPRQITIGQPMDDEMPPRRNILLDTSVIIDGRITDISKTGFLTATLLVPNFVLSELQNIADSADPIRRKRGRRGLEVLNALRTDIPIPFEVTDADVSEVRDVDSKLVALARHLGCPIMTNDYNLNRVAGLQGVTVLNINDLANAVKAAYLPGEELDVRVIQEGREYGQGVGYLDDGTMVVVEEGRQHIGETLQVIVTKVLQTSAGRMIFARHS